MPYSDDDVNLVYDKAGGRCFYCGMQLSFHNYGKVRRRGAWEIDHFIPLASGGADQPYNWVPACVPCNTDKGDLLPWHFNPDHFTAGERDPNRYL